jgi:D-3-phosphoglycerate dehydrogenase / 2-oxoglutarate reductase
LNAARGGIIDELALQKLLDEGHLRSAGIDTWENEPVPNKGLSGHARVVATPHIGASTVEAQIRIGQTVARQTLKALRGEIVDFPVNLPHLSVLQSPIFKHYVVLAEKLGSIASQLLDFSPSKIKVNCLADVTADEIKLLHLSVIKGFLTSTSDEFVSYVNTQQMLQKRGIGFEVVQDPSALRSRETLAIEIEGPKDGQRRISVGGTLYDGAHARLLSINGFLFEIEPEGELLVIQNNDKPGVIGSVGTFLASRQINIAQFELSRNAKGDTAMSILKTDSHLNSDIIDSLKLLPHVLSVRVVTGI